MSVGISCCHVFAEGTLAVACEAHGTRDSEPTPEDVGRALGMIFAAGEAALAIDPYGKPSVATSSRRRDFTTSKRLTFKLCFKVSSEDVLAGGPIHRSRMARVAGTMYGKLEELFRAHLPR